MQFFNVMTLGHRKQGAWPFFKGRHVPKISVKLDNTRVSFTVSRFVMKLVVQTLEALASIRKEVKCRN